MPPTEVKADASSDAADLEQDFSTLLAQRYKGGREGRIVHWIVWNEADSSAWFDMSPKWTVLPVTRCAAVCGENYADGQAYG